MYNIIDTFSLLPLAWKHAFSHVLLLPGVPSQYSLFLLTPTPKSPYRTRSLRLIGMFVHYIQISELSEHSPCLHQPQISNLKKAPKAPASPSLPIFPHPLGAHITCIPSLVLPYHTLYTSQNKEIHAFLIPYPAAPDATFPASWVLPRLFPSPVNPFPML